MGLEKKKLDINIYTAEIEEISLDNHSYEYIPTGRVGKVQQYQQMILCQEIIIDGDLILDGTLVLEA